MIFNINILSPRTLISLLRESSVPQPQAAAPGGTNDDHFLVLSDRHQLLFLAANRVYASVLTEPEEYSGAGSARTQAGWSTPSA